MPRLASTFGEWRPDLRGPRGDAMSIAENVLPAAVGYVPVKSPVAIVSEPVPGKVLGAGSFRSSRGNVFIFAGTSTNLYRVAGDGWESVGSGYSASEANPWQFSQFGNRVIASNGSDVPVFFDMSDGSATFQRLPGAPTAGTWAPMFKLSTVVLDFLVGAIVGEQSDRVQWSAINNIDDWRPGFGQADYNIAAEGGAITGLSGGRYGLVFQEERISRMEYVAGNLIFQFTPINREVGCLSHRSVASLGRLTFFLSARGFYVCDGSQVTAIGDQAVDRTFLDSADYGRLESMSAAIDPDQKLYIVSLPAEDPESCYAYSWELQKWTRINTPARFLFVSRHRETTIGEDHAPTMPADSFIGSGLPFGDPAFLGGRLSLAVFGHDNVMRSFSGPNMRARLARGEDNLLAGHVSGRLRRARLVGDAASGVTLRMQTKRRYADAFVDRVTSEARGSGDVPLRLEARHARAVWEIEDGVPWTFVHGAEYDVEPGSRR